MPETGIQVILLDGNQRSSLAVVRSLGCRGIKVLVGEQVAPSLAGRSRYCTADFVYPAPASAPDQFRTCIRWIVEKHGGAMLLPMTDITMGEILKHAHWFSEFVTIPFGDYAQYSALSDKALLFRQASALNIPMPASLNASELDCSADDPLSGRGLSYPVVVKPEASRIRTQQGWIATTVGYAHGPRQLSAMLTADTAAGMDFLIQEKIQGPGIGIFLLLSEGRALATFAHQRVREKPPSGGVSVVCRSIDPPDDALQSASTLIEGSGWSGVAMVEFKRDVRDGRCKLMEVNARFWGSLQLAISAGVDFPYLLYRVATGHRPGNGAGYRKGICSRWELGDLDHLLIRLKGNRASLNLPVGAPTKTAALKHFLEDFARPGIRSEVMRPDDPGPFIFEVNQYAKQLLGLQH